MERRTLLRAGAAAAGAISLPPAVAGTAQAAGAGSAGHDPGGSLPFHHYAPGGGGPHGSYFPAPASSLGPRIPASGYYVGHIRGGLYWVTDGGYQSLFLVTAEGVVVMDAPLSIGTNLGTAIAGVTRLPVTHVIYSHHHDDHIGAAGQFGAGVTYVAHAETANLLRRAADPMRPIPTRTFTTSTRFTSGGRRIHLDYHGPNHSPGNIFIHLPDHDTLMVVDIVYPGFMPFKNLSVSADVPGFITAHDEILRYRFTTFVGGHVTRLGTRHDVDVQKEFIHDLRTEARSALQSTSFAAVAARVGPKNPGNPFPVYVEWLDEINNKAAKILTPRWKHRLAGTDVFIESNVAAMVESLRSD